MIIDKSLFAQYDIAKLVKGTVVPRAVAWTSTISEEGIRNLAPFSFFTVASLDPVIFCISISPGSDADKTGDKDTLANIRATGEFVINIVSESQANQMHETSKNHRKNVDEFQKAGLPAVSSKLVGAPRVSGAPVNMECKLNRVIAVGRNYLVLGRLVCYHIREDVYIKGDKINYQALQPIGRMAGDYTYVREFFELPHPYLPVKDSGSVT